MSMWWETDFNRKYKRKKQYGQAVDGSKAPPQIIEKHRTKTQGTPRFHSPEGKRLGISSLGVKSGQMQGCDTAKNTPQTCVHAHGLNEKRN